MIRTTRNLPCYVGRARHQGAICSLRGPLWPAAPAVPRSGAPGKELPMPRPARPWFRFYVEAMRDPKMRRLTPTQRWLWVAVLAAARESTLPGTLLVTESIPMTVDDLSDYAGMRSNDVERGLILLRELGMMTYDGSTWRVPAWSERQYESDDVTQRTRRHRSQERGRNVPTSFDGTPPETETEAEEELDPPNPHSVGANGSRSSGTNPRATGTNPRALNVDAVMTAEPCPLGCVRGWIDNGDYEVPCELHPEDAA